MCELHDAVRKSLQDTQGVFQTFPLTPRKKLYAENAPINERHLTPMFLPPAPEASQKPPATHHKKLWELDRSYHCSVIGTCLTLAELRQIQRRLGGIVQALDSDYDLHRAFVGAVREATPASRLIHKHLDRKYKLAIRQLSKAQSMQAFDAYWGAALASGDIAGAYWALITHPNVPDDILDRVYGEVHMLSHLSGASVRVDLQELNRLKRRCPELEAQWLEIQADARRRLAEQQDVISALNKRLVRTLEVERQLQAAEARLAVFEERSSVARLTAEVAELTARLAGDRVRIERAEAAAETWKQQATRSIDQNQWLARQLAESRQERDTLESTLEQLLASSCMGDNAPEDRSAIGVGPDLVGRCVLYVGGRNHQCAYFRALVERCNGRFIHHDGGREEARARLWDVVQQADAVLCPLDCVSHDAVHRIKRFCERHTKPLVLLPRASLAAFNYGLSTVAS
ncbi:MAG: DUF2325 domain-containing protein [Gammaproteobacteria bacterium]|nr:DUF2325 domain-containing protein [Gammaproteobacteria bacterium]MCP5196001.1 DUF2325 domain-containing protein [Gammaproteobacteria bacterium]